MCIPRPRLAPIVALVLLGPQASCARGGATPPAGGHPELDSFLTGTIESTTLAPGVHHRYMRLPAGPWAVHVVEVDERVCAPEIAAIKAGPPLDARAATSALAAGALAAINADFFMLPGGTPVGAHVTEGRVLAGPGSRPVYALDAEGRHTAGPAELRGFAAVPGDTAAIARVNRPPDAGRHHPPRDGLGLYDAWYGPHAPADPSGRTVRLRRLPAEVGETGAAGGGRGVVVAILAGGDSAALDGDHVALQARGASAWLDGRVPGDTVTWRVAVVPGTGGAAAVEAVGGFPLLVAGGRGVLAEQEGVIASFGDARHPRTAVGWNPASRRLLWVVVDGRQEPYSAGMTLPELESLLLRLGATEALNLDGGGSTTLALTGRVANRPSDSDGERPVANVLALRGCEAPPGPR